MAAYSAEFPTPTRTRTARRSPVRLTVAWNSLDNKFSAQLLYRAAKEVGGAQNF